MSRKSKIVTGDKINSKETSVLKIVLNSLKDAGAGFGVDTNKITIVDKGNNQQNFELKSKTEVAKDIVAKMVELLP